MIGISSSGKSQIGEVVEEMFDSIALQFIGEIPALKDAKRLVISSSPNFGLPHLFVQAMHNKKPNDIEADVLKSLLESAHGYIESLKNRTKSNLTEQIDGLVRQAKLQGRKVDTAEIQDLIATEMKSAKAHMKTIAEAESTKFRNLGTMMDITRVSASLGDEDPTVFFVVVRDGVTCNECKRLHLMPDGITPRLWKFSELKQGYHKRSSDSPSIFGLHPHCRCTLTYLSKSYGFNEMGKLTFKTSGFDAYAAQRK